MLKGMEEDRRRWWQEEEIEGEGQLIGEETREGPIRIPTATEGKGSEEPTSLTPTILHQELIEAGWPGLELTTPQTTVTSLCQAVAILLGQQNMVQRMKEDYEDRLRRVNWDYKSLTTKKEQLQNKLEKSLREVDRLSTLLKVQTKDLTGLKKELHSVKEETKLLLNNHTSCKNQFSHSLRKRDAEVANIKERSQKILNNKFKSAGIHCLGLNLPRTNPEKDTEDYYTEVVRGYHTRESALARENQCLRDAVTSLVNRTRSSLVPPTDGVASDWKLTVDGPDKVETELEVILDRLDEAWVQHRAPKLGHDIATQTVETMESLGPLEPRGTRELSSTLHQSHPPPSLTTTSFTDHFDSPTSHSEMTPHTLQRLDRQERLVQLLVQKNKLLQAEIKKAMVGTHHPPYPTSFNWDPDLPFPDDHHHPLHSSHPLVTPSPHRKRPHHSHHPDLDLDPSHPL